jgi:hypothetical protein
VHAAQSIHIGSWQASARRDRGLEGLDFGSVGRLWRLGYDGTSGTETGSGRIARGSFAYLIEPLVAAFSRLA